MGTWRRRDLAARSAIAVAILTLTVTGGRADGQVRQVAKLIGGTSEAEDRVGESVAVVANWAFAGTGFDNDVANSSGAVYVFSRDLGQWNEHSKLIASDAAANTNFGRDVDADGTVLVVGARDSAYVFRYDGIDWLEEQKLLPSSPTNSFGGDVAVSGDLIAVGAQGDNDMGTTAGAVYTFRFNGSSWDDTAKLTASDGAAFARFGGDVALDGTSLIVGAVSHAGTGAAYAFRDNGKMWVEDDILVASDAAANDDFGRTVDVHGDVAVIGAPFDDSAFLNSGSVYVFTRSGFTWTEADELTPADAAQGDEFGWSVGIQSTLIMAGSPFNDEGCTYDPNCNSGAIYLFAFNGVVGSEMDKLTACDRQQGDEFGRYAAMADCVIIVGSDFDDAAATNSGSAYLFADEEAGVDCDLNGIHDACDLLATPSLDCNGNGLLDACETPDCNANDIADACEIADGGTSYAHDDGEPEAAGTVTGGGSMIWFNAFTVVPGGETIESVRIAWGHAPEGTPSDIAIWSDPNDDGIPFDAVLETTVVTHVTSPGTGRFALIQVPPTFVGNAGEVFYVGAHQVTTFEGFERVAFLDQTTSAMSSWFAGGGDLVNLALNPNFGLLDSFGMPGNWLIRAGGDSALDCDDSGTLDQCEGLLGDTDDSLAVDVADLLDVLGTWVACPMPCPACPDTCPTDVNDDCNVDVADLLVVLANWS